MTNGTGKKIFSRAGELGVPVGIMCFKVLASNPLNFKPNIKCIKAIFFFMLVYTLQGLHLHILEIEELCMNFPSTVVILDHVGFCKPPL